MRSQSTRGSPASAVPTTAAIRRVWRGDRCVQDSSAAAYLLWVKRFRVYSAQRHLDERAELTLAGVRRFVAWYGRRRHPSPSHFSGARAALYALSRVYQVLGLDPPAWAPARRAPAPATALLRAYGEHLASQRGNPAVTIRKKLAHVGKLLQHLAQQGKTWRTLTLSDIDACLVECSSRYARASLVDIACSLRSFARFLSATGRIAADLAESVIAPVQRKWAHPPRALPWADVQRLLHAVDTTSARGLRDYALLLLMSTYGFGAGEVTGLRLQDIDWTAGSLKVVRPKTGVAFAVPLLPAVAKVLARYLRHGRPPATPTRHVFVRMKMPFSPLGSSSAVRHILRKHAKAAGIAAPYLGSHVLRHSNAARQLDVGTCPRLLAELLGQRDPESVSAYVRVATQSLRDVSLPVPT